MSEKIQSNVKIAESLVRDHKARVHDKITVQGEQYADATFVVMKIDQLSQRLFVAEDGRIQPCSERRWRNGKNDGATKADRTFRLRVTYQPTVSGWSRIWKEWGPLDNNPLNLKRGPSRPLLSEEKSLVAGL